MKALLTQLFILVVIIIAIYIAIKIVGFVGGEKVRLPFLQNRKKMFNPNKTVIVSNWTITELDEAGYSTSHTSEINFKKNEFCIGQKKNNDFVIDNKTVTKKHAVITDTPEGLLLRDNSSTNGVKHNGKPVKSVLLKDGMILQFGTVYCKFSNCEEDNIMDYIPESTKVEMEDTFEKEEFVQRKL